MFMTQTYIIHVCFLMCCICIMLYNVKSLKVFDVETESVSRCFLRKQIQDLLTIHQQV